MKFYRIKISSWTASFRYPNIISGYQPTLEVPPVSTILGLMNACAGKYLDFKQVELGYYFEYDGKAVDLETIYQIECTGKGVPKNDVKSNVIRREFLFDCRLYIYLKDKDLASYFRSPHFLLVLGRSCDLATVEKIEEIDLQEVRETEYLKGQLIPFRGNFLPGLIQALPLYFTDEIPRRNIRTEPFTVVSCMTKTGKTNVNAFRDNIEGKEIDIYMHNLTLENE